MSSTTVDLSDHDEHADLSPEVNQQPADRNIVIFNRHGEAVGPNATHFKAKVGKFVTTYVPISYTSWSKVDQVHKDDVWNEIVRVFKVPSYLRESIERSMPSAFRKLKSGLRKSHLDMHTTLEAKKMNIPPGIAKEDWEKFCIYESSDKQIELRAKAKESKKRSLYGHTGGRKSAAMVEYEMVTKRNGSLVSRSEVWIETHTRKNRTPLPSALPFLEQVQAKVDERKESARNNIGVHPLSIDDDPLTQVLGKKSKGLPGVGSYVSKSKYNAVLHSHIMHSEEGKEKKILEKKVDEMNTQPDLVCGSREVKGGSSKRILAPEVAHLPIHEVTNMPTPQAANRSSTQLPQMMKKSCRPTTSKADFAKSTLTEPTSFRMCELLNWDNNVVALAEEVTDPIHKYICHNYRLKEYEMKVSMSVKKIYSAKLYKETPDAKTIHDVGLGDFFVWPKSHINFVEPKI